ncbi:MAG: DMT family transporter [Simkaniaceae bacterium]|nr:DMT family transporter [Simkaniaceae bacterium]
MRYEKKTFVNVFLLLMLALCWSFTIFFLKKVLIQWKPFTSVAVRLLLAAGILYLVLKIEKRTLLGWHKHWYHYLFMGVFSSALPFSLIAFGVEGVPSTIAGIIHSTPSLFTALLSHYTSRSEKISREKIIGISLGFLGLLTLLVPALIKSNITNYTGILYILLASFSYAIGMIYSRTYLTHLPPLIGPINQLFYGGIIALPFAIYFDPISQFIGTSSQTLTYMLALAFFPTALTFVLYYSISKRAGATYLSTATLLFPCVTILRRHFFQGEPVSLVLYTGCSFIVIAVLISSRLISIKPIMRLFAPRRSRQENRMRLLPSPVMKKEDKSPHSTPLESEIDLLQK